MPRNDNTEVYIIAVLLTLILSAVYFLGIRPHIIGQPECDPKDGEMCPLPRGGK